LNRKYFELGELKVKVLGRGFAWLDPGTYDGLENATEFVRTIQNRQGLYIGAPTLRVGLGKENFAVRSILKSKDIEKSKVLGPLIETALQKQNPCPLIKQCHQLKGAPRPAFWSQTSGLSTLL